MICEKNDFVLDDGQVIILIQSEHPSLQIRGDLSFLDGELFGKIFSARALTSVIPYLFDTQK